MDKDNKLSNCKFGQTMKQFISHVGPCSIQIDDKIKELEVNLKVVCDKFMIPLNDEKRIVP